MRRIAAAHMTIGKEQFSNHVIELDDDGIIVTHYPLTEEIAMCEWRNRYDQQS